MTTKVKYDKDAYYKSLYITHTFMNRRKQHKTD